MCIRDRLTTGYWVTADNYPKWAETGIFIIAKSIWITEEGKDTTRGFYPMSFKTFFIKLAKLEIKKFS